MTNRTRSVSSLVILVVSIQGGAAAQPPSPSCADLVADIKTHVGRTVTLVGVERYGQNSLSLCECTTTPEKPGDLRTVAAFAFDPDKATEEGGALGGLVWNVTGVVKGPLAVDVEVAFHNTTVRVKRELPWLTDVVVRKPR